MRPPARMAALTLAASLAACATSGGPASMTPPPTRLPPAGQPMEVTGKVSFDAEGIGASVEYGPWRVLGPGIDLSYGGGGSWSGTLSGSPARLATAQGRITGPGCDLVLSRSGDDLVIQGTWSGRRVDLAVSRLRLKGSLDGGACTFDLGPGGPSQLSGTLGCTAAATGGKASGSRGALLLAGEAILVPDVLMPQFVLALLASLPL